MSFILDREVALLRARLPSWWPSAVTWAVELANHGPGWLPIAVRCVPLRACALVTWLYARGWL